MLATQRSWPVRPQHRTTVLVADGVTPSNESRGYVVRMLLRRAARHGMTLGLKKPFLFQLVPVVVQVMQDGYPELRPRRESIAQTILAEEERFHQMLAENFILAYSMFLLNVKVIELAQLRKTAVFGNDSQ